MHSTIAPSRAVARRIAKALRNVNPTNRFLVQRLTDGAHGVLLQFRTGKTWTDTGLMSIFPLDKSGAWEYRNQNGRTTMILYSESLAKGVVATNGGSAVPMAESATF